MEAVQVVSAVLLRVIGSDGAGACYRVVQDVDVFACGSVQEGGSLEHGGSRGSSHIDLDHFLKAGGCAGALRGDLTLLNGAVPAGDQFDGVPFVV